MNPPYPSESPSPHPVVQIIDWEAFEILLDITEAREEPEMIQNLLSIYESDVRSTLAQLRMMGPESHIESRSLLHKLKGASGSLAFTGAVTQIKLLHDPLESPPAAERQQLIIEIRDAVEQCLAYVRARHPWLSAN